MRKLLAGICSAALLSAAVALPARGQTPVGGYSIPSTPSACPTSPVPNYNYGALFTNQGALCVTVPPGGIPVGPSARTIVALDISTVTTGGTAVTALNNGHRTAGGFLFNPIGATIALCINEQGTASGTTSAGATTCVQPGQSYTLTPAAGAVSVITSDSSHPFSGYGLQ